MADPEQPLLAFTDAERTCLTCARTFLAARRQGRDAAYCTDTCRQLAKRLAKGRWRDKSASRSIIRRPTCEACGGTFEQRGGGPLRRRCDACNPNPTEENQP